MTVASQAKTIHVIGAPLDLGAGRRGVDMGPSAIRIAGLGERIAALGIEVVDRGDVLTPVAETRRRGQRTKRYIRDISRVCERLYDRTLASLDAGATPLVLGGDHSLAVGSVAAVSAHAAQQGKTIGLLWVDAHADMNTPSTTLSGNVHGMPLAAILGPEPSELSQIGPKSPKVNPSQTVLLGVRDLDSAEKDRVLESGVHVFTMKEIDQAGLAAVAARAVSIASRGTSGIHVSFDLDVCDPSIAPGVGTPVKGGLNYREAHTVMEVISDSGALLSLDVVEANPILDTRNMTAQLGVELVLSALGKSVL